MKNLYEITSFIAPDGEEYVFDNKYRALLTEEGLGMPPIEYVTQQGPFQHGKSLIDYRLEPRTVQLLLRHNSDSREEYWINRSRLLDILRPNRSPVSTLSTGKLRKVFTDGRIRDLDVVLVSGPVFNARALDRWDEWGFTETLRFIAHDPIFYDPTPVVVDWPTLIETSFGGFLTFDITFPIIFGSILSNKTSTFTYDGSWLSYPTIVLTGPLENVVIENESTGEFIRLLYDIPEGETVTIDLRYGNKTVTSSEGTNLIGTVSSDSDLVSFHIAPRPEVPGGVNTLTVQASAISESSSISVSYYNRYIGI